MGKGDVGVWAVEDSHLLTPLLKLSSEVERVEFSPDGGIRAATSGLTRIRLIRRAQQLGFTLKEIEELLELRVSRRTSCAEVRSRAEAKIADFEARIHSLRQMSRALGKLAHECEAQEGGDCPLLKHLEGEF